MYSTTYTVLIFLGISFTFVTMAASSLEVENLIMRGTVGLLSMVFAVFQIGTIQLYIQKWQPSLQVNPLSIDYASIPNFKCKATILQFFWRDQACEKLCIAMSIGFLQLLAKDWVRGLENDALAILIDILIRSLVHVSNIALAHEIARQGILYLFDPDQARKEIVDSLISSVPHSSRRGDWTSFYEVPGPTGANPNLEHGLIENNSQGSTVGEVGTNERTPLLGGRAIATQN